MDCRFCLLLILTFRVMNLVKSRQFNGSWIQCIQICRLSLAISFRRYVKLFGQLSMMKSTYPIVISTAIIQTLIRIHMVNPAVYGRLITFSTTRNSSVLFSSHAEQSSKLNVLQNAINFRIRFNSHHSTNLTKCYVCVCVCRCFLNSMFYFRICSSVQMNASDSSVIGLEFAMEQEGSMV